MLGPALKLFARIALGLPLVLAGCASLIESEPASTFPLRGVSPSLQVRSSEPSARDVVVAVERPMASGAVAGDRLVVEVGDQLQFVSGARWEDDLPTLLGADIARALQATEGINVVDAAQLAGRADFGLVTVIERMQVDLGSDYSGQAVTELIARLVKLPSREIVATATFRGQMPAADDAPNTLAEAISKATQDTLSDLAVWVAAQTRAPRRG